MRASGNEAFFGAERPLGNESGAASCFSMGKRPDWASTLFEPLLQPTVTGHRMACLQIRVEATRSFLRTRSRQWARRAGVRITKQVSRPTAQSSCVKAGNHQRDLGGVISEQAPSREAGTRTTSTQCSCVAAAFDHQGPQGPACWENCSHIACAMRGVRCRRSVWTRAGFGTQDNLRRL